MPAAICPEPLVGTQGVPGLGGVAGPPGPSVVSSDAGNVAVLGSDFRIYVPSPSAATANPWRVNPFTPTTGQTSFVLSNTPVDANSIVMFINGQSFCLGMGAFTVAGATATWTGSYTLYPTDSVAFRYQ